MEKDWASMEWLLMGPLTRSRSERFQQALLNLKEVRSRNQMEEALKICPMLVNNLVNALAQCPIRNFREESSWNKILEEGFTVLTHFSSLSSDVRQQMAELPKTIRSIAGCIITSAASELKRAVLRFLAVLATYPCCAQMIASDRELLRQLITALKDDDKAIVQRAFRVAQYLINNGFGLALLQSLHIGIHLGNLLVDAKAREDSFGCQTQNSIIPSIIELICNFVRNGSGEIIGKQLCESNCVPVLLELFLSGQHEQAILEICYSSFEFCCSFEGAGFISRIIAPARPRSFYVYSLVLYFVEIHVLPRNKYIFKLLFEGLASDRLEIQQLIAERLRRLAEHDPINFSFKIVDNVVCRIRRFLHDNQHLIKKSSHDLNAVDSNNMSGMPQSKPASWTPSNCSVRINADLQLSPEDDYLGFHMDTQNPQEPIIVNELCILRHLSFSEAALHRRDRNELNDENAAFLQDIRRPERALLVIDALLRYAAVSAVMISPKELMQFFWKFLITDENLTELELPTHIVHTLMNGNCSRERRHGSCSLCSKKAAYGNALLVELESQIKPAKRQAIETACKSSNDFERFQACITTVYLRMVHGLKFVVTEYPPVKCLLNILHDTLADSNYKKKWRKTTYLGGPTILYQIVTALSYLVPFGQILNSLYSDYDNTLYEYICRIIPYGGCKTLYTGCCERKPALITFTCGDLKETVRKQCLCEGSEYFRSMLEHGFSEQNYDTFKFDEDEQCNFNAFRWLLHYICGCGNTCLKVSNEDDILKLLQIADRYACWSIVSMLLAPYGPLKTSISAQTLPSYLQLLLFSGCSKCDEFGVLRNACISYLLRYCTEDEMFKALEVLAGDPQAAGLLIKHLETYLNSHSQCPFHVLTNKIGVFRPFR